MVLKCLQKMAVSFKRRGWTHFRRLSMTRSQFHFSIRFNIFQWIGPYANKSVSLHIFHAPILIDSQKLNQFWIHSCNVEIISGATISQANVFQAWEILSERIHKEVEYLSITVNTFSYISGCIRWVCVYLFTEKKGMLN